MNIKPDSSFNFEVTTCLEKRSIKRVRRFKSISLQGNHNSQGIPSSKLNVNQTNISSIPPLEIAKRKKKYRKISIYLVGISTSFLSLNFLYFYCKLVAFSKSIFYKHNTYISDLDEIVERVSHYLYYLNFSVNFYLYTVFGSSIKIRNVLQQMTSKERSLNNKNMTSRSKL